MAAKRELIDTGTDKRSVRRNKKNQFKESDDVGPFAFSGRKAKSEDGGQGGIRR